RSEPQRSQRSEEKSSLTRDYLVGTHHFVVAMFENVAMPHVAAGESFKAHDDARNHAGIGAHGILPTCLVRLGRNSGASESEDVLVLIGKSIEAPAIENLKSNEMEMNGMGVVGQVHQIPYLHRIEGGIFSDGRRPSGVVQEHEDGILNQIVDLGQREGA